MTRDPVGRRAIEAFRGASVGDRLHVWGRWRSCPFAEVAQRVPATGSVLDVGCGHGLLSIYLALAEPGRIVTGVDIDERKLSVARDAARTAGASVTFSTSGSPDRPDGRMDVVLIVDMLYLLPPDEAHRLLTEAATWLAPGGHLLVKEMSTRPRWKLRITRWQEVVATRVLRITQGATLTFLPPSELAAVMRASGLVVDEVRLDRWRLHPHHLLIGTRREGA